VTEHRYTAGDRVEVRSRCTGGVRRWVAATVVQAEEGYAEVAHDDGKPSQRYIYSTRDVRPLRAEEPAVQEPATYRAGDRVEVRHRFEGWLAATVRPRAADDRSDCLRVTLDGDPSAVWHLFHVKDVRPLGATAEQIIDVMHKLQAAAPRHNATCLHCGGPAYVGLAAMECMREGGCAVPAEPEPGRVELVPWYHGSHSELVWRAIDYEGRCAAHHPIREEAIRLWRTERRKRMAEQR
jgi:hypothetical protein